jgi:quercetin dioxygenase-like cupin family protein
MPMRQLLFCGLAAMISMAASAQEQNQLAAQGGGPLPEPTNVPATLGGTPPANPFVQGASGVFSRTVFQTDEDPNFTITIRDYSFPPDGQTHTVTLPAAALLHLRGQLSEIGLAGQQVKLTAGARMVLPAGAPVAVTNTGEQAVVVRAVILEAK